MMSNVRLDGHRLGFEHHPLIVERPRFLIESNVVALGPYLNRAEHERVVLQTVGSVDWFSTVEVDEFRFNRESGLLQGVALRVPEHRPRPGELAISWADVEDLRATPKLIDIENFQVAPTLHRVYDRGTLLCLREGFGADSRDLGRVGIAPELSLLFVAGDYVGWRLENVASALEDSDEASLETEGDEELSRELDEYLEVTSFPDLDLLFEGDVVARERLEGISRRLGSAVGAHRHRAILIAQIGKLISDWYQ
jgi:hypothetical protein